MKNVCVLQCMRLDKFRFCLFSVLFSFIFPPPSFPFSFILCGVLCDMVVNLKRLVLNNFGLVPFSHPLFWGV